MQTKIEQIEILSGFSFCLLSKWKGSSEVHTQLCGFKFELNKSVQFNNIDIVGWTWIRTYGFEIALLPFNMYLTLHWNRLLKKAIVYACITSHVRHTPIRCYV
jgi:glycopeptide antibiotics resistance protein